MLACAFRCSCATVKVVINSYRYSDRLSRMKICPPGLVKQGARLNTSTIAIITLYWIPYQASI
ncbi:hypothetical protein M408DRAFT_224199 [Serendipita vermifera MAFF 305830]|uniref:Uncharacterized protein n=1 Tax=Serendipita vermifera MAFF 305830 TaxID=933852 RepID=A0A0C3AUG8_SERVB|nr:hypothetical protein M408DRAFT_277615 [Serendipita vermifera MAFF 305830]KIM24932.1 hypothetical protein M408DRAFT_224199 [Serendipita vermifera MAFF 305830]